MGNKNSTSLKRSKSTDQKPTGINHLENMLRDVVKIASITVADLFEYREEIKPAIVKITGNKEKQVVIKVDRNKIYEEASRRFIGKITDLGKIGCMHERPVIEFNDGDELDVDGNGFRREYYAVYFRRCLLNMFEGKGRQMVPRKDCTKKDELKALGIAIVECILNEDCGFPYLNMAVYKKIIDCEPQEIDKYLNIKDMPDGEVRYVTEQIQNAATDDELTNIVSSSDAGFLNFIGWPTGEKMTLLNREVLLQSILRWYIIDNRHNEIEQLKLGLRYMGFYELIKSKPWFEPLFVYSEQYSITSKYMKQKLHSALARLEAANDREKLCKKFAATCIDSLDDEQARMLFFFITNLYDPPIEEETFEVVFNRQNPERILPESYTCLNRLILPLGNKDIDRFKDSFWKAIMEKDI